MRTGVLKWSILSHMHQYVPCKESAKLVYIPSKSEFVLKDSAVINQVLIGGDQLTAARARGAITAMSNSVTPQKRLEGLIPVVEDWHTQVILLEVYASACMCIHARSHYNDVTVCI